MPVGLTRVALLAKDMDHATAALQESLGNSVYTVAESNVKGKVVAVFGCGPTGEQVGGGTG